MSLYGTGGTDEHHHIVVQIEITQSHTRARTHSMHAGTHTELIARTGQLIPINLTVETMKAPLIEAHLRCLECIRFHSNAERGGSALTVHSFLFLRRPAEKCSCSRPPQKGPNIYEHKEEIVLPRHDQKGEDKCLYFPRPQQAARQRGSRRRNWNRLQSLQDKLLYRVGRLLQAISASFFISILSPSFWCALGMCAPV